MLLLTLVAVLGCAMAMPSDVADSSITCKVCDAFGVFAVDEFEKDITPKQLQAKMDGFCTALPLFAGECKSLVDEYIPAIYAYLKTTGDQSTAHELCEEIDLCTADLVSRLERLNQRMAGRIVVDETPAMIPVQNNGVECDLCTGLGKAAIDEFESTENEAQLEAKLMAYCREVSILEGPCDILVRTFVIIDVANNLLRYVPKIYQYLNSTGDQATAKELCQYLDLCPMDMASAMASFARSVMRRALPVQQNGVECDVCTDVGKVAIDVFEKDETEAQLEAKLINYCRELSILEGPCDTLVKTYVPKIYQYLNSTGDQATAAELCQYLGLCEAKGIVKLMMRNAVPSQQNGVECDVCTDVGKVAIDVFETDETEAQLETKLVSYCRELSILEGPCDMLVKTYVPKIYQYLNSKGDQATAMELCQYLGLC